jgi:AraC-like DNA-binding protein
MDICREFLPAPELRDHVECIWNTAPIEDPRFEIVPDGSVDVCFVLSPQHPRTLLFGTTTRTVSYELEVGVPYLGVRFRPGSASLFAQDQVPDLTDASVVVSEFLGITADEMLDTMTFPDRRNRIESAIRNALPEHRAPGLNTVRRAVALIDSRWGDIRIGDIARKCEISKRQLERQFVQHVGIAPKLYARIRRFRAVLDRFQDLPDPEAPRAADLAAAFGYADQSHLIRDFQDFSHPLPRSA